ncbi:MAG: PAS domain S-box protein [Crocinitomicaceae bacterium]|nr:PAS domain S-box protein [Crocinitomicaceae bacterium]
MKLHHDSISHYLSQILNQGLDFDISSIESFETDEDRELAYGLICLSEDLTFYKQRSDNLRDNLKEALFNSSAIAITNTEGVITEVNDIFVELTGYSKHRLLGNTFSLISSNYHSEEYFRSMWNCISSGKVWEGEFRNQSKNGNLFWVNTHIFPIRNTDGVIIEYWSIRRNITEKKNIEEELKLAHFKLEKASETKDFLMKEMHHRIKNNLQLLVSMLRLMIANENELRGKLEKIINRINSIATVHEVFYKHIEKGSIDLKTYLSTTFDKERFAGLEDTHLEISGESVSVSIEQCTYLGIVMNELITNSTKYAWLNEKSCSKKIIINYRNQQDQLLIDYYDNGQGFSSENVNKGFGSSIIEMLVEEQLGGNLKINSTSGMHATIEMPLISE